MADKTEILKKGGLALLLVIAAYWLFTRGADDDVAPVVLPDVNTDAFAAPYQQNTPGIMDSTLPGFVYSGGSVRGGDMALNFNIDPFNQLSQQVMPLFGFVGAVAVNYGE